jgi:diguanylate cyclase (GGDEF)-like protein
MEQRALHSPGVGAGDAASACTHQGGEAVPQQPGYGRGLAALFPGATNGRPGNAVERYDTETARAGGAPTTNGPIDELLSTIASTDSGIALIYRSLDLLVAQFDLEDAAVVLEERQIGRQIFCAGRRPLGIGDDELLVAPPGLYTQPALEQDDFDRSLMLSLCVLALRLDVVRYDAWHDPLTGLYDRRSFDRLLDMAVARGNRYGWQFTLVILDLDGLKQINDTEGHPGGDAALRELGERFRQVLRIGDDGARIGGDEFALILPNTPPEAVDALLERARNATGFERSSPSFSYGWAQIPGDATERDQLVAIADQRLYEAKKHLYAGKPRSESRANG